MSTTTITTTITTFPVTTILSSSVEVPTFHAFLVESSYEEDWDLEHPTNDIHLAEEWYNSSSQFMFRTVRNAVRVVPRPKPRLPRGYHHKEW